MQTTQPRIAVMDSGVGGLSVLASIEERLPAADFIYCADNAHFPYGPKTEAEVVDCVCRAARALAQNHKPHLLVVACNTASTAALPHLRAELGIPIIGVVPALKPAAALSRSRTIGLLATPGTILRPYTDDLIRQFADGCKVLRVGSSRLVEIAEEKLRGRPVSSNEIRQEIAALFGTEEPVEKRLDIVVLGCTHFPLLRDELAAAAAWPVTWLDSGSAIADRAAVLSHKLALATESGPRGQKTALFTRDNSWQELRASLERIGFSAFGVLPT